MGCKRPRPWLPGITSLPHDNVKTSLSSLRTRRRNARSWLGGDGALGRGLLLDPAGWQHRPGSQKVLASYIIARIEDESPTTGRYGALGLEGEA